MKRLLVLELWHLDVNAGVDLAVEVCLQHGAVGRKLDAGDGIVAVELAPCALGAYGAREKANLHAMPGLWLARLVGTVRARPEVNAEHPHGSVRVAELVAPLRREADAAYDVEPPAHHVGKRFVVVAIDVVHVPVRVPHDGLQPHLERPRPRPVGRHLEEVAAAVRRNPDALLRP